MNTNLFDNTFPFTGLFHRQADTLGAAVKQLESILRDLTAVPDKCVRISALVSEGDSTCREIERELSLTFIQPLDREDIRELSRAFQRTLQAVGAVSSRLGLYGFREIQKGAAAQAACLAEMADEIAPSAGDRRPDGDRRRELRTGAKTQERGGLVRPGGAGGDL